MNHLVHRCCFLITFKEEHVFAVPSLTRKPGSLPRTVGIRCGVLVLDVTAESESGMENQFLTSLKDVVNILLDRPGDGVPVILVVHVLSCVFFWESSAKMK